MSDRIDEIVLVHNILDSWDPLTGPLSKASAEEIAEHLRWLLTRLESAEKVFQEIVDCADEHGIGAQTAHLAEARARHWKEKGDG